MAQSPVEDILDFWFGERGLAAPSAADFERWYGAGERLDAEVDERYRALLARAREPALMAWRESARGSLAYVLLVDQFPLHIYRRRAEAFAWEREAVIATLAGLAAGHDRALGLGGALFYYLPLMHAEDLVLQRLSIACLDGLRERVPAAQRERVDHSIAFARGHLALIERFGRFPHRNAVLNRLSTEDELAHLASGAARYGQ